jgi:predicted TIM-barrel fold metal-dependent hydrolase
MAQYEGLAPDDPRLEPYWALAEALEVPVGLHLGVPNPGAAYHGPYRVRDGSPLALEEVLVRHPRLRLYIMHAGYPFFLQRLVAAGFSDRVMFGTDQGVWPGLIERSIDAIAGASYLSAQQKRDILYNNAARFLRLSAEEIARHHAM